MERDALDSAITEMGRAVSALWLELPPAVAKDVARRWQDLLDALVAAREETNSGRDELPISMRDSLAAYLVSKALAEERRGYGHATGEDVADAVLVFLEKWETNSGT